MFQQTLVENAPHHLIRVDRMSAESAMELSRNLDCVQNAVQRMMESDVRGSGGGNGGGGAGSSTKQYEGSMLHLLAHEQDSGAAFIVLPRAEYNQLRQEFSTVKQSLNEFQTMVNFEIQQIRQDNASLKTQLGRCKCASKRHHVAPKKLQSSWHTDNGWEQRPYSSMVSLVDGSTMCSPAPSSPERAMSSANPQFGHGINPPRCDGKLVQLLPNYDIFVNRLNLQIIVNEAVSHKEGSALYVLRRLIPLVFSWEELACSCGQGLNCKTTENNFNKIPLDPVKVQACKGYMRKFCLESGCPEPSERAINQTFSHQVNYARRRTRAVKEPGRLTTTSKKKRREQVKAPDKYLQI